MSELPLFPLLRQLSGREPGAWSADFFAGLAGAMMLVPQGIAYATLAGLPPIVGLYAAIVPPIGYALLGTSRELSIGPIATDSLLVLATVSALATPGTDDYVALATLLALLVGGFQLAFAALRFDFLTNFLSISVMSGFVSAAAIVIIASQLPTLLGLGAPPGLFLESLARVGTELPRASLVSVAVAVGSVALLLALKRFRPRVPGAIVVTAGSAIVVFLVLRFGGPVDLALAGEVAGPLPLPKLPVLADSRLGALLPGAAILALVSYLEALSVADTFAKKGGYRISPRRELVALGASNVLAGLFRAYPVTGGLSRSAVVRASGPKSTFSMIFASLFVALTLLFFAPALHYVPKVVLAAIVVVAAASLVDVGAARHLYAVKRADFALWAFTLLASLVLGLLPGIALGILASLGWFVLRTTRPHIAVLGRIPGTTEYKNLLRHPEALIVPGILVVRIDAQIYFGNVDHLRSTLARFVRQARPSPSAIVLDASAVNALDASGEALLHELGEEYGRRNVALALAHVKGPVLDVLERTPPSGRAFSLYATVDDAVRALERETAESGAASLGSRGPVYVI